MKWIYLYAIVIYLTVFGVGSYLNHAHGEETTTAHSAQSDKGIDPKSYIWPRTSRTDALMRVRVAKSCQEYLSICERSCKERGTMYNFFCIGQNFQPFDEHFRCLCADDLYSKRQTSKQDRIQVEQGAEQ